MRRVWPWTAWVLGGGGAHGAVEVAMIRALTASWEVATVAFEIARRHRPSEVMATLPPDVAVHALPAGEGARAPTGLAQLRGRGPGDVASRIDAAHRASGVHHDAQGLDGGHR